MSKSPDQTISVAQLPEYKDQICPACGVGTLREELCHDAMEGNSSVLRCDKKNPCHYLVAITLTAETIR